MANRNSDAVSCTLAEVNKARGRVRRQFHYEACIGRSNRFPLDECYLQITNDQSNHQINQLIYLHVRKLRINDSFMRDSWFTSKSSPRWTSDW